MEKIPSIRFRHQCICIAIFVAVNVPDEYKVLVFIGIALALFTSYVILWILANKTTSKS